MKYLVACLLLFVAGTASACNVATVSAFGASDHCGGDVLLQSTLGVPVELYANPTVAVLQQPQVLVLKQQNVHHCNNQQALFLKNGHLHGNAAFQVLARNNGHHHNNADVLLLQQGHAHHGGNRSLSLRANGGGGTTKVTQFEGRRFSFTKVTNKN